MSPRLRILLLTSTALFALATPAGAQGPAVPTGPSVVGGTATVTGAGTSAVTIRQSTERAIINWNTFNIPTGGSATFYQPGTSSITLNRVTGGLGPSMINGSITANGRVFIINRDGMLFGRNAVINTSGFLATTHDIRNEDFMAGRMNFNISGRPDASIVNLGTITANNQGFAALVAPGVRNSGTISAHLGTVALAAGNSFTLDMYGDRLIQLAVGDQIAAKVIDVETGKPLTSLVTNEGTLRANGGRVQITAAAARQVVNSVINNSGVIEANTVGTRAGRIVLGGATRTAGLPKQTIRISGRISATGKEKGQKGGTVQITGEDIQFASAMVDVSGHSGGGTILVGGDYGGGKPISGALTDNPSAVLEGYTIPTASTVTVDGGTTFNASATVNGNGGKVIVWSDTLTTFAGTIFARGGEEGGNGGFVEVSGKESLAFSGTVNTLAPNGKAGTLLLDPFATTVSTSPNSANNLNVGTLVELLSGGNVIVTTSGGPPSSRGNLTISAAVTWTAATTLTLQAKNNLNINAPITAVNGGLTVEAGGAISVPAAINVGTFTLVNGSWTQISETLPAFHATDFRILGGQFLRATGGDGSSLNPYQITDIYGLQGIGSSSALLNSNYRLVNDIDASGTANWNGGQGFQSVGNTSNPFTGGLNGQGFTINGLTIAPNNKATQTVGLFGTIGATGSVSNLNITNASVAANVGFKQPAEGGPVSQWVGILAGENLGTITNVTVTGTVSGLSVTGVIAGGLVGTNGSLGATPGAGTILNSHANVNVVVGDGVACNNCLFNAAGGLVGANVSGSSIVGSSAAGNVSGGDFSFVGGLVAYNSGTVSNSTASGNASVGEGGFGGGFVGGSTGTITNASASGNVTGGPLSMVGGFAAAQSGSISNSHATGNVTAESGYAGGFIAFNYGSITLSYATGEVSSTGRGFVGGFVGMNSGTINQAYATGAVSGGPGSLLGGFVGLNVTADLSVLDGNELPAGAAAPPGAGAITQSYALGTVTGNNAAIAGGFAALNLGTFDQIYGAGRVQGATTLGGLIGANNVTAVLPSFARLPSQISAAAGTATNAVYDLQTTGLTTSAGGTGFNTSVLVGGLPAGFDPNVWGSPAYPYLLALGEQNTKPGPPVLPPVVEPPVTPVPPEPPPPQPPLSSPGLPPPYPQIASSPIAGAAAPPPELVPTAQFLQQQQQQLAQQQQQQQQQQQPGQSPLTTGSTAPEPVRLDVGDPNRYFYLPALNEPRLVSNEVVLEMPCNVPQTVLEAILKQHSLTVLGSQCLSNGTSAAFRMRNTSDQTISAVIRSLAEHQIIVSAQANYLYALAQQQPEVQSATSQQGDPGQYVPEKLNLLAVHRFVTGKNISIGVIDSEVDGAHPDLTGAIANKYDATGVDDNPHAHGTGMAGAIVSHRKLLGVAPNALILAIRAFSTRNSSPESTTYHIVRGLDYAVANNMRIVNMSFAGPRDPSLERALKAAHDKGVVLIAAAGNAGPRAPAMYPAADPHVIAVTATDSDDRLFGGANVGSYIAIASPGVDILVPAPAGEYQVTTGTSVATAHVSGVVALMLERNPRLTPADVRRILTASAKRLGPANLFGAGLIDPVRAVEMSTPRSTEAPRPAMVRPTATAAAARR